MPAMRFTGPYFLRLISFRDLNCIALSVYFRRVFGKKIEPTWSINQEIGVRFVRHQFTRAFNAPTMVQGRLIFDSLQLETPDKYDVDSAPESTPKGNWYYPRNRTSAATVLYYHGGGYTFHGGVSDRFAQMLAHHIGAPVFCPNYRLTPEHPHPAQAEDAMVAWNFISSLAAPKDIVVIGDSAGGHMMLSLLLALKDNGFEQPALGIGLCPWTDIGDRGSSLRGNDQYDLVQGWMALQFGQWLDPDNRYGRAELSPISHDFSSTAPLYLQIGGHDILYDMCCDFAKIQAENGARVMLDVWPSMAHEFQALDSINEASRQALLRIREAVNCAVGQSVGLAPNANTTIHSDHR